MSGGSTPKALDGLPAKLPTADWKHRDPLTRARRSTVRVGALKEDGEILFVGSGVVVDATAGLIVTARHVAERAWEEVRSREAFQVAVFDDVGFHDPGGGRGPRWRIDGAVMAATWEDSSEIWDLAVLRIRDPEARQLHSVPIRPSQPPSGAPVVLFGFPTLYGGTSYLRGTMGTQGFAWGEDQEEHRPGTLVLHLHCAPGESGGPIVDAITGDLVGVVVSAGKQSRAHSMLWMPDARAVPAEGVRSFLNGLDPSRK